MSIKTDSTEDGEINHDLGGIDSWQSETSSSSQCVTDPELGRKQSNFVIHSIITREV